MNELEKYYNKFNEDKRLNSRHGQVEFAVTMKYIHDFIAGRKGLNIVDIGAGTGAYAIPLCEEGHKVTAIELVNKNLSFIKKRNKNITAKQGNAINLKLPDNTFDLALLFGPQYHLISHEEKLQALLEAKRVVKPGGVVLVMYLMNEYAFITYAIKEKHLMECLSLNKISDNYDCVTSKEDLYSYVRLEEINLLQQQANLTRKKIIAVDGATDYIRQYINALTNEEFEIYKKYQLSVCERPELLGASSHVLDILQK